MKQNKRIRKVTCILILLGLMLCVGACSKKGTKENTKATTDITATPEVGEETSKPTDTEKPTQEPEKESEDNKETAEEPQFLYDGEPIESAVYEDSFYPIVFDRPMYQVVSEGMTQVFNRAGSLFIAYSIVDEEHPELTAKDVMTTDIEERFCERTKTYYTGRNAKIEIDSTEDKVINGVDCMRFVGNLVTESDGKERKRYAVGYTFVKENIPCLLIGVVVEDDQTQLHKDEVTHNVDEMIKTLRDKR